MVAADDDRANGVLVVEDEYFIAQEMALALKELGAYVLGPIAKLDEAMEVIDEQRPCAAILDVNLQGVMAFTLADRLVALDVPFIFATGYDVQTIPERFNDTPRFEKPFDSKALAAALALMAKLIV